MGGEAFLVKRWTALLVQKQQPDVPLTGASVSEEALKEAWRCRGNQREFSQMSEKASAPDSESQAVENQEWETLFQKPASALHQFARGSQPLTDELPQKFKVK